MIELILMQRVDKLGQMGDLVKVRPGYARNHLIPSGKAIRANKDNLARFEREPPVFATGPDSRKVGALRRHLPLGARQGGAPRPAGGPAAGRRRERRGHGESRLRGRRTRQVGRDDRHERSRPSFYQL